MSRYVTVKMTQKEALELLNIALANCDGEITAASEERGNRAYHENFSAYQRAFDKVLEAYWKSKE